MFKTSYFLLFICILFVGCNSLPNQTGPVPVEQPTPKAEPKPASESKPETHSESNPEIITRIIEPELDFAGEVIEKANHSGVRIEEIEIYPHGAPKKLKLEGTKQQVDLVENFALGKDGSNDCFVFAKYPPMYEEDSSLLAATAFAVVNDLLSKSLLTSVTVAERGHVERENDSYYDRDHVMMSITGTALGIKTLRNIVYDSKEAVIPAKPAVIEKAFSLLKKRILTKFVQRAGYPTCYVAGSQKAIDVLNKLAAEK